MQGHVQLTYGEVIDPQMNVKRTATIESTELSKSK